jgi:hypothetical protein
MRPLWRSSKSGLLDGWRPTSVRPPWCSWYGLADTADLVIGCHLTRATRVHRALEDVASTVRPTLRLGRHPAQRHGRAARPRHPPPFRPSFLELKMASYVAGLTYDACHAILHLLDARVLSQMASCDVGLVCHACHVILHVSIPRFLSQMAFDDVVEK